MNKSGFGECLRRGRELRGVSQEEISAATRIGPQFLEALENEEWERLPGGVFNRGFLRGVARFLGLDEDDLIAQYDLAIRKQHSQIEVAAHPPARREIARSRSRRLVRLAFVGTLCGIVLFGTGSLGWRRRLPASQAASGGSAVGSTVLGTVQPEASALAASNQNARSAGSNLPEPTAPPSGAATRALELKVEAGKETAVSVSADGSKVFEGSMIAGQSRTFTARDAIDISAEDAGALLLELNGQTLAPLGPPGQHGNVTLTRGDVKPSGGGAD